MLQFYTIGLRDSVDCGNLKECIRPEFFRGKIHLASAESLFVRETDMGADGNIILFGPLYGLFHNERISRVKTGSNIG